MSSGVGIQGGTGRCYGFFRSFMNCVDETPKEELVDKCSDFREDYFECLHHKKELSRMVRIAAEKEKQAAAEKGGHH